MILERVLVRTTEGIVIPPQTKLSTSFLVFEGIITSLKANNLVQESMLPGSQIVPGLPENWTGPIVTAELPQIVYKGEVFIPTISYFDSYLPDGRKTKEREDRFVLLLFNKTASDSGVFRFVRKTKRQAEPPEIYFDFTETTPVRIISNGDGSGISTFARKLSQTEIDIIEEIFYSSFSQIPISSE